MSAFAALRIVSRAGPARIVAGMRISQTAPSLARSLATRTTFGASRVAGLRAFSMTSSRFGSGTSDIGLSQKLQEELKFEQQPGSEAAETPEFLKTFTEQGVWSIEDTRGNDEVALARKFGDENIRVVFSIADLATTDEFTDPEEEPAEDEEDQDLDSPIRVSVSVTKTTGPGALNIDLIAESNSFTVENVSFYEDAKVGTELTAEADWKRRGLYMGPDFQTLDVTLQEEFEKYLQERGINESMAGFIPEYAAHKEQQEYVKWLGKVKGFVDL